MTGLSDVDADGRPEQPEKTASGNIAGLSSSAPEFKPGKLWKPPEQMDVKALILEGYAGRLRGGYWNTDRNWWSPYYVGRLKSFNARTGYGFMECEETDAIYKMDVYIHKSQVLSPFKKGQYAEFGVVMNSKGQPQAIDVMWLFLPDLDLPPMADNEAEISKLTDRRLGTVKSYSTSQGYGFITGDLLIEEFGNDVYLDRAQMPSSGSWQQGQVVEFDVVFGQKRKPQARQVNWDPVPALTTAVDGARKIDNGVLGNLSNILAFLRKEDLDHALEAALRLEVPEDGSVDYVSFVLDRIGLPESVSSKLGESLRLRLVVSLSEALAKYPGLPQLRISTNLAWVQALLGKGGFSETTQQNQLREAMANLSRAAAARTDEVCKPVLAVLQEML